MRRVLITMALFLLLGFSSQALAQHDEGKPQQGHQNQQGQPEHQAKPSQESHQRPAQHPPEKPQSPYGAAYHGGVKPNGPTHGGVHHSGVPQHQDQVQNGFNQSRARAWDNDHRTWRQRGGYNGYRIPDDRYRQYFGADHYFRIYELPMLFVGGYPRFQYDGYWVTFADPWPESWPSNWYQTDDVYLNYADDGYYLYDRSRPGPAIAVTISF
jgi:hypothetical protein